MGLDEVDNYAAGLRGSSREKIRFKADGIFSELPSAALFSFYPFSTSLVITILRLRILTTNTMVHSSFTGIEDESTTATEKSVIQGKIEAMQKFINEEKEGIPLSSVTPAMFSFRFTLCEMRLVMQPKQNRSLNQSKERMREQGTFMKCKG